MDYEHETLEDWVRFYHHLRMPFASVSIFKITNFSPLSLTSFKTNVSVVVDDDLSDINYNLKYEVKILSTRPFRNSILMT